MVGWGPSSYPVMQPGFLWLQKPLKSWSSSHGSFDLMPTSARRKLDGIVSAVVYLPKSPLTATQVSASSNEKQPQF